MDIQPNFVPPQTPPIIPPHKSIGHWFIVVLAIITVLSFFITSYYYSLWPFGDLFPQLPPLSPSATLGPPPAAGQPCGGIAGLMCPDGYTCQLEGNYPDAGGSCIKTEDSSVVPDDWQTYRNEEYGFEFRYPEELGYMSPEGGTYQGPLTDEIATRTNILIIGYQSNQNWVMDIGIDLEADTISNFDASDRNVWLSPTQIIINGVKFQKYTAINGIHNGRREFYVGSTNSFKYTIGITDLILSNQILSTFKFIE